MQTQHHKNCFSKGRLKCCVCNLLYSQENFIFGQSNSAHELELQIMMIVMVGELQNHQEPYLNTLRILI